jgi:CMP-N,N'-diacetyllegionaminic acid synthase
VSTDSEDYAWVSRKIGAETPFLRPAVLASDESTDLELFRRAINWTSQNEDHLPEYWIHLRPTTPLREPRILKATTNCSGIQ